MDKYEANNTATDSDQEIDEAWQDEFKSSIEGWMAEDMFTNERIMERLTFWANKRVNGIDMERDHFKSSFQSHSNGSLIQCWDRSALNSFLEALFPDSFAFAKEAGSILFTSLAYLSTVPFPTKVPSTLAYDDLARAVIILLPEKSPLNRPSLQDDYIIRRQRTIVDDRRLLFKSLAAPTQELPSEGHVELSDILILDENNDMPRSSYFLDVSAEEEDMTDILDVLASTQPQQGRGVAQVPRAWFIKPAGALSRFKVKLGHLRVSRSRMLNLLKYFLANQLENSGTAITNFSEHAPELERIAHHLLNAFVTPEGTSISWPIFNNVIAKSLPLLLSPLYRLLELFFAPPDRLRHSIHLQLSDPGKILTLPLLSQLSFFLPTSVSLYTPQQLCSRTSSDTADGLAEAVSSWQGPSVLLVSASTPQNPGTGHLEATEAPEVETHTSIFGAFISQPWKTTPSARFGSAENLLFQLAPIHEVFPATKGGAQYAAFTGSGGLIFGDSHGISLSLDEKLAKGNLTQEISGQGSYECSSGLRNGRQWGTEFTIASLEVWGLNEEIG